MFVTSPKHALALCDICQRQVKYTALVDYIYNRKRNGLRVCKSCFDKDNPQLWVGEKDKRDPQALRNPRSDRADNIASRGYWGWSPVIGFTVVVTARPVTVTIA